MVETTKYDVVRKDDSFEIRRYHEMLIAQVDQTQYPGFNTLFQYISGNNKGKSKISMTSPVITSEKIAMTSPVMSTASTMSFVVPSEYTMETVPEPSNAGVSIVKIPERYVATVRFRGFAWKNEVRKQTQRLLEWVNEEGIKTKGSVFLMQYNPPFVPGFLRRNEMGIEIVYEAS
ncbi:MAG: heme-binding protein [Candidatus Bathyarchaeota archaeon]|nr:heme-binding protein [Candidatus Bathyarchaeota archaeon]